MVAILLGAAGDGIPGGSTPSPSPGMTAVAAGFVVERARGVFGPCDAHETEARFDRFMVRVCGLRHPTFNRCRPTLAVPDRECSYREGKSSGRSAASA